VVQLRSGESLQQAHENLFRRHTSVAAHDSDNQKKRYEFFQLQDAFEKSLYGQCLINVDDKAVVAHACWASGQKAGEKKAFTSSDEWLKFVGQTYMTP
jgi:hypothetical protein